MNRPNIIYLHSHDTGRYISPYGHAIRTPNLQRFAERGVLFRQAFCANPTCSPSRASLLTGRYAHNTGMLGLAHRGWSLDDYSKHLVHTLRRVGYASALCGIQHIAGPQIGGADAIGYDQVLQLDERNWDGCSAAAAAWLEQRDREQPFFLSVGFFETHRKFPTHEPEDDPRHMQPPSPLPDTPEVRRDMADYATMAHQLDTAYGRILDTLDRTGLAENTVVIITTDHGIAFPQMKCCLTDHGIGVLLMMRGPAGSGLTGGRCIDALVSHIDLFPTLCDVVQIEPPDWLQGVSLMPLVRDDAPSVRDEVFAEVNYHAAYEPKRCVRTERYKYIKRYDGRSHVVLPNCDDSSTKDALLGLGWRDRPIAQEELYDLVFNPNETDNLAARPDMADVLDQMRTRLDRWMRDTDDPILAGPIPLVEGGVTNDPDGLSPQG